MVNIDEFPALSDMLRHATQTLEARTIGCDHDIEAFSSDRFSHPLFRVEKPQFVRDRIFIPYRDVLPFTFQGQGESELAADAIAIGPYMSHHTDRPCLVQRRNDLLYNFWAILHSDKWEESATIEAAPSAMAIVNRSDARRW